MTFPPPDPVFDIIKLQRIREALQTNRGFGASGREVEFGTKFSEMGFDSLDQAEFMMWLEDKFNIEISDADADSLNKKTIKDLIDYITQKAGK